MFLLNRCRTAHRTERPITTAAVWAVCCSTRMDETRFLSPVIMSSSAAAIDVAASNAVAAGGTCGVSDGASAGRCFDRLSRLCRAPVLSASDPLRFFYRYKLKLEMVCASLLWRCGFVFSATANAAFSVLALR